MTLPSDPGQDPPAFQLLNEIGIIAQLSGTRAERLLAPDLTMAQFVVLNHFHRLGGERSLVRLAAAMQVTKAAMTNTIARLHAKGLVSVRPDPNDGRGKLVALLPPGEAARHRAIALLMADLGGLGEVVEAGSAAALLATLRHIRAWLDANR
jgi:DNA-binding MarR family transcriptional regulator